MCIGDACHGVLRTQSQLSWETDSSLVLAAAQQQVTSRSILPTSHTHLTLHEGFVRIIISRKAYLWFNALYSHLKATLSRPAAGEKPFKPWGPI
jgi:hypothetical protein